MLKKPNINFYLKQLSVEEIERYLVLNDNNLFEKLSARLDIHEYSKKLFDYALHFTLYKYDNLVAFSPCYFNKPKKGKAYISALIVRKSFQGLGLEKILLEHIKGYAKYNNFNEIYVSFHCHNIPSIEFYESNLFVKDAQHESLCTFKFTPDNK